MVIYREMIRKARIEQKEFAKENAKFGIYAFPGKEIYQDWINKSKKELGICSK